MTPFYAEIIKTWFHLKSLEKNKTAAPKMHFEIRKEILWGNQHIRLKGKCLLFKTWIKSGIIFVNDIINKTTGKIDENIILDKLNIKSNWISQLNIIKASIPGHWKTILESNDSTKTVVNTKLEIKVEKRDLQSMNNKDFYRIIIDSVFVKPYVHNKWENLFDETINWTNLYLSWNETSMDNRIKQFKFKLIHNILAFKENLFKWKIAQNNLCNICNTCENIEHFFITCAAVVPFLELIQDTFAKCGFRRSIICLKSLVVGYKIGYAAYADINTILNLVGFCIYKCYYISEKRSTHVNILPIFIYEFNELYSYKNLKSKITPFLKLFRKYLTE